MGKLLETIVNRWVMNYVELPQLLSPFQLGFRRGREVFYVGWRLVEDVVAALKACHQVQAICCKLQRKAQYNGPIGFSKDLATRLCLTSNVPTDTLTVCSVYARSIRAILLKLVWDDAFKLGNEFTQVKVK